MNKIATTPTTETMMMMSPEAEAVAVVRPEEAEATAPAEMMTVTRMIDEMPTRQKGGNRHPTEMARLAARAAMEDLVVHLVDPAMLEQAQSRPRSRRGRRKRATRSLFSASRPLPSTKLGNTTLETRSWLARVEDRRRLRGS